jgi:hypothetical protein
MRVADGAIDACYIAAEGAFDAAVSRSMGVRRVADRAAWRRIASASRHGHSAVVTSSKRLAEFERAGRAWALR